MNQNHKSLINKPQMLVIIITNNNIRSAAFDNQRYIIQY